MVVFMEIAEQMNGSSSVETESKGDETKSWKGTSKSKQDEDETTSGSAVLSTLPFEISKWQVYNFEDFTRTSLACGFFGDVYKVEHVATKEIMCLKVNKPDHVEGDSELSHGEIALLQRLSHPNLLRFMGICLQSSQVHLLTEFMNGGSLEDLLMNHEESLYWSERLYIAQDIAKALAYLHKNRIIHRDLASKNCLIRKANRWKYAVVGDLGLATEIPKDGTLQVVGSPYNMAPEMIRGEQYDETADVFSYGIILCEIIGRVQADPDELPRTNQFGLDVDKFQHMVGDCPLEFVQVAICCCQLDPHSRPEFTAMVKILDLILSGHTRRPLLEDWKEHGLIIHPCSPTETDNKNNNHINDVKAKITGTAPTIVVSEEQNPGHKHGGKRRASSLIGKYKLFNSATEDLLKTTPGKLKSFFSNILRHREMHVRLRRRKKSKEEKKRQSSCSELKRHSHSLIPDDSTDVLSVNWSMHESKSETCSLASSISCPGTPDLDRVDGCLQTSSASKGVSCDLHIPTHLVTATDSENILSPLSVPSDTESDPFSFSSSLDNSPRTFENDAHSCSSSVHSRSASDGDVMDPELDIPRRHSSPMHVFEQLRNLKLEKRSATYLVSGANSAATTPDTAQAIGAEGETNHVQQTLEKPKFKRTKSPFSFLSRKSCRSKTDPH